VAALNCPLIVLFEQQRADEAGDCIFVWEDVDDIGTALNLAVEPFERIDGMDFRSMILGEAHDGEHVSPPHP